MLFSHSLSCIIGTQQHNNLEAKRREERDGRLGPEHEVDADTDPTADDKGRSSRRSGMDAEAEGGVQVSHRLHSDEQVQRQRLVPDLRL